MSSTGKTINLSLNQWVKTDPVLMDDFNSDNQKIDTAIGSLDSRICFEMLREFSGTIASTPTVTQIDMDVSDIDFTKYAKFWLTTSFRTTSTTSVYFRINGKSSGYNGSDDILPGYSSETFPTSRNNFLNLYGSNGDNNASSIELTVGPMVSSQSNLLLGNSFSVAGTHGKACYRATSFSNISPVNTFNFVCSNYSFSGNYSIFMYGLRR